MNTAALSFQDAGGDPLDSTLKIVREQGARERQIAAISRSGASKEDMEELKAIRQNGLYRDAYDLYEAEKIADILEELFSGESEEEDELLSVDGIREGTATDLRRRGIETKDDLRAASDEDLLDVPSIGSGRLKRIRASL